jgi:hypothetical protein
MEALSKIGEFFFDDGRASEEERIAVYEAYKEKMRKQNAGKPATARKSISPLSAKAPISAKATSKKTAVETETKDTMKVASKSAKTKTSGTKTTSTRTRTTGTRTTESGQGVSPIDDSTSSEGESSSGSSSTDDLESMVPETVCADLSIRSVSSKSVISESGSDSQQDNDSNAAESKPSKPAQGSKPAGSTEALSQSAGSARRSTTGLATRAKAPGSKTEAARARAGNKGDHDNDAETTSPDNKQIPDVDNKKASKQADKSHFNNPFSKFLTNAFRFRSSSNDGVSNRCRSSSTTYTRGEDTLFSGVEEAVTYDEQGTLERKMVDQILGFIGVEDGDDGEDETFFYGSHSTETSQDSHTQASSHIPLQRPSDRATSAASAQSTNCADTNATYADSWGRKPSASARNIISEQTPTLPVVPASVSAVGLIVESEKPAIPTTSGIAVTSCEEPKANPSVRTCNTAQALPPIKDNTAQALPPIKAKAIHGWMEEQDGNEKSVGGCVVNIELAVSPSTAHGTDTLTPSDLNSLMNPVASSPLPDKSNMEVNETTEKREIKPAANPSVEAKDVKDTPISAMFRRKSHQPKATAAAKSNVALATKANVALATQQPPQGSTTPNSAAKPVLDDALKAFQSIFFAQQNTNQEKCLPPMGIRSFDRISPTKGVAFPFSQFFTANLAHDDSSAAIVPHPEGESERVTTRTPSLPTPDPLLENDGNTPVLALARQFLNSQVEGCPPKCPGPTKLMSGKSNLSHSSLRHVTVSATCSADSPDIQEYIEVTCDSLGLSEDDASTKRTTTFTPSQKNCEEQESVVATDEKDSDGVYMRRGPGVDSRLFPGLADDEQTQEQTKCSSPRRHKLFGKRLLPKKKKATETTSKASDVESGSFNVHPRHLIGQTSALSVTPASPIAGNSNEHLQHVNGDTSVLSGAQASLMSQAAAMQGLKAKNRTGSHLFASKNSEKTDGMAKNGFKQAIGDLHVRTTWGEDDANRDIAVKQGVENDSDNQASEKGCPTDAQPFAIQAGELSTKDDHSRKAVKIRLPFFHRARTRGSDYSVSVSQGHNGIELTPAPQVGTSVRRTSWAPGPEVGIRDRRSWARSIGSVTRTKLERKLALGQAEENAASSKHCGESLPLDGQGTLFKANQSSALPSKANRKVTCAEAPRGGSCVSGSEHNDTLFDNPWRSGHPNYEAFLAPARDSFVTAPVDTNLSLDAKDSNNRMSLSENCNERNNLKKVLAHMLAGNKKAKKNFNARHREDEAPLPIRETERKEPPKSIHSFENPTARPTKEGLGKLKCTVKRLLRLTGKKTHDVQGENSPDQLQTQKIGGTSVQTSSNHEDPVQLLPGGTVARPLKAPSCVEADDAFLVQHQRMQQPRNPLWQPPSRPLAPRGKGTGNLDGLIGVHDNTDDLRCGKESQQAKINRVLGGRGDKDKRLQKNQDKSLIEGNSVLDIDAGQQLSKLFGSLSPVSSSYFSVSDTGMDSNDGTAGNVAAATFDANTVVTDEQTAQYSVQNQRVLDTLRHLHAVKKRKSREDPIFLVRLLFVPVL